MKFLADRNLFFKQAFRVALLLATPEADLRKEVPNFSAAAKVRRGINPQGYYHAMVQ